MKTNCDYCGSIINDSDEQCPNCGAVNTHYLKHAPSQPKTIEELQAWYKEKNFPPEEVTRFFIGKDVKEAKAFGIYKDEERGTFIVYKNKADGTRAVRYDGGDEEYAVNELFQKLREEASKQKARNVAKKSGSSVPYNPRPKKTRKQKLKSAAIPTAIIAGVLGMGMYGAYLEDQERQQYFKDHPSYNRYYEYDDNYYYNLDGEYYWYDNDAEEWSYYGDEAPFNESRYQKYTMDEDDLDDVDFYDFEDTSYFEEWHDDFYDTSSGGGDSNYDSDDDDDWDSGWDSDDSWDSGGGDWDSDW